VSQRGAALLQAAEDGHRGRADAGLRQLLAGVSLDRAGDAQRLEQAMSGQPVSARASVEGDADAGMLLASLQRSVNDARKDVHPGARGPDSAAPIAGAGAAVQSVTGADQPGRPAAMLNLLATPADPEFAPEFAGRLQMMVKNGMREASVQLHPAELGRLQLTVSTDGDQARIAIVAETSAARDMIENSMPRLRDMLEQSGLQLAQGDVSQRQSNTGASAAEALGPERDPAAEAESEGERAISISTLPPQRLLDAYV
ncbi:MAG: flagellar hook-length control protein FliK, partial [Chromatocurvus sp.]